VSRVFLAAEWRYLAMLNYVVAPDALLPYVPPGTELDLWNGASYVSVVGFLFANTRVLGVPIPFHHTFEEINLRIYVRRDAGDEIRRGVTFVRELVPRHAIAIVARAVYNEPYRALPMRRHIRATAAQTTVDYEWRGRHDWAGVHVSVEGTAEPIRPGSEEAFIAEHDWGYTRQRNGSTIEYQVQHPKWKVWPARTARLAGNVSDVYPPRLAQILAREPDSAFLADGSAVTVHTPTTIGPV
jgi:uncharacterized protein YqjF (DUF2071 family)